MNLGLIETDIYDTLNLGRNPDSAVQRHIRRYINDVHREVLTKKNIGPRLRRQLLTFNTSGTSPFCVLPQSVVRVFILTDRTNNNILQEYTLQSLRYSDPGLQSSGAIPYAYVIMNLAAPVAKDPTAATQLFAVSDSALDGTGLSVNVEGLTSDGQYLKASVGMNGVTPVALSTVLTWLNITKFYLSAPAQGHISLKDGLGNVLGVISPSRAYNRYSRIHLFPTSTAVLALTADVELHIEDMANPADEPILPEDFHDILVSGALAKEYNRRSKASDAGIQLSLTKKRIGELQVWMTRPTGTPYNDSRPRRFSTLGPNFPNGS